MIYVQLLIGVLLLINQSKAALSLCASKNTGSTSAKFNTYQSNGYCKDQCSGYSFAILQGSNCWCSNTQPSEDDTSSTDDCSDKCPGYPSDNCGKESDGLYGYIQLAEASSTDGGDSSTTTSSSTTSTSSTSPKSSTTTSSSETTQESSSNWNQASSSLTTSSETSTSQETTSSSTISSTPQTTTTSSSSTSTSQSTTSSSSTQRSTSSVSPQTSIIYSVRTITGSAQTQATTQVVTTVTNAPSTNPSTNNNNNSSNNNDTQNQNKDNDGFFDSKGKVAGTFTAVGVVVLAMLSTLLYCCCFKKRHQDEESSGANGGIGAIGLDDESANSITNEKYYDQSQGQYGQIHGHVPQNSDMTMNPNGDFVTVDQRLDPRQMFMNWENGSRKSLADELDYSRRVLRVTNE